MQDAMMMVLPSTLERISQQPEVLWRWRSYQVQMTRSDVL